MTTEGLIRGLLTSIKILQALTQACWGTTEDEVVTSLIQKWEGEFWPKWNVTSLVQGWEGEYWPEWSCFKLITGLKGGITCYKLDKRLRGDVWLKGSCYKLDWGSYWLVLSQDRRETHDDGGQCWLDMLIGVRDQVLHTG